MATKILSFIMLLFILGCAGKTVDTKAEGEKLMQISRDWSKAAAAGNVDSILNYWTDDAIIFDPAHPAIRGKQAIREMVESSSKTPGFRISWEPKSVSVSNDGSMAYLIEETHLTMNDSLGKPSTLINTTVTIWRKNANGDWKNVVEVMGAHPR